MSHQARIDWWRGQFQRQQKASLSVTEFCLRLGVSITTFYYWKKRIHDATRIHSDGVPVERSLRSTTTTASTTTPNFVPLSIVDSGTGSHLEIELGNACVVRLKGPIDPVLLQAAIAAAGQLDGCRQGAQ
jgi:hypothetical protein